MRRLLLGTVVVAAVVLAVNPTVTSAKRHGPGPGTTTTTTTRPAPVPISAATPGWTFSDTFPGANGTLDTDRYPTSNTGTGAAVNVQSNRLRFNPGTTTSYGGLAKARIYNGFGGAWALTNPEMLVDFQLSSTTAEIYPEFLFRASGSNWLTAQIRPSPASSSGVPKVELRVKPADTVLGSFNFTFSTSVVYRLRTRAVGALLYVTLWDSTTTEPAPQINGVTTALTAAGDSYIQVLDGASTTATMDIDNLKMREVYPTWVHPQQRGGWYMPFREEFGAGTLDTTKWVPYYPGAAGTGYWLTGRTGSRSNGAGELSWNTLGSNLTFHDGMMTIQARAESTLGRNADGTDHTYDYSTGVIASHGKYDFQYGYIEARLRLSAGSGPGIWPTAWLLPSGLGWPPEFDIMEAVGKQMGLVPQTIHHPDGTSTGIVNSIDWSQWHEYGVEWNSTTITLTVDGVQVLQMANTVTQSMYLLVNLAIGGASSFGGAPDGTTVLPASLDVDWVRVWQPTSPAAAMAFPMTFPATLG